MDFNTGLQQMVDNISLYENDNISLNQMKENLFGLYELIDGFLNREFSDQFHEYWDFIEEVYAVSGEDKYKERIDTQIIPRLKQYLVKQLDLRGKMSI
jgi:hypothetical protein